MFLSHNRHLSKIFSLFIVWKAFLGLAIGRFSLETTVEQLSLVFDTRLTVPPPAQDAFTFHSSPRSYANVYAIMCEPCQVAVRRVIEGSWHARELPRCPGHGTNSQGLPERPGATERCTGPADPGGVLPDGRLQVVLDRSGSFTKNILFLLGWDGKLSHVMIAENKVQLYLPEVHSNADMRMC